MRCINIHHDAESNKHELPFVEISNFLHKQMLYRDEAQIQNDSRFYIGPGSIY